jgi:hypothetical protein
VALGDDFATATIPTAAPSVPPAPPSAPLTMMPTLQRVSDSGAQIPEGEPGSALERRLLAQQGSETSGLGQFIAIVSALKGNFSGLLAIEDAKRRTALGKAMVPEIRKYHTLLKEGKLDEAGQFIDALSTSFGQRAPELVPYLTQMSNQLDVRSKDVQSNQILADEFLTLTPEGHPWRPVAEALKRMADSKKWINPENLRDRLKGAMPHVQILNNQVVTNIPITGETQTQALPQVVTASSQDDYVGNWVAARHGITTEDLAGVLNGISVTNKDKQAITPDSEAAQQIKRDYVAMLPIRARLKLAPTLPMDPTKTLQAIRSSGALNAAMRAFTPKEVEQIESGVMDWITKQKVAEVKGGLEVDPFRAKAVGLIPIDLDPDSPTWLRRLSPQSYAAVAESKGKVGFIDENVYNKDVQQSVRAIEGLELIPIFFSVPEYTPTTRGNQIEKGLNDWISQYLGYPVTEDVELRQAARVILEKAINAAEDIPGHDSREIAALRQYLTGSFRTNADFIQAAEYIRMRLGQSITRALGGQMQVQPAAPDEAPATIPQQYMPRIPSTQRRRAPVAPPTAPQVQPQRTQPQQLVPTPAPVAPAPAPKGLIPGTLR